MEEFDWIFRLMLVVSRVSMVLPFVTCDSKKFQTAKLVIFRWQMVPGYNLKLTQVGI